MQTPFENLYFPYIWFNITKRMKLYTETGAVCELILKYVHPESLVNDIFSNAATVKTVTKYMIRFRGQ